MEPCDGGAFGDTRCTIEKFAGMISDQDVAAFAVYAFVSGTATGIFRRLTSEGKIDRESLPRCGGGACAVVARCTLLELCRKASGTLLKDGIVMGKFWNASNMFVGIEKIAITGMSKALMPEETFGFNVELMDAEFLKGGRWGWLMVCKHGVDVCSVMIK